MKKEEKKEITKISLFDATGKKKDTLDLDKDIFTGKVNKALLYQALIMYRANQRQGNADTKSRGEVSGGGKKPWRQKGTGRARAGSIRSPLWRHGATSFGPGPRDYSYHIPKKMLKSAFLSSLNAKLNTDDLLAIENLALNEPKTKKLVTVFKNLRPNGESTLFLVENADKNLKLAARNIRNLKLKNISDATAFDVLSYKRVVMTKAASELLSKIVKK